MDKRAKAKTFFQRLETHLNSELPNRKMVEAEIAKTKENAKLSGKEIGFEPLFFKKYVVPKVSELLTEHLSDAYSTSVGTREATARGALLAEGYADPDLKKIVCGTPASTQIYPYKKTLAATLKDARKDWWGTGKVLSNSCPDLSVLLPEGPSIVFEGKLFKSGGLEAAKSAIVAGLYECFFYRGFPTLLRTKSSESSNYEYACFLAYDASSDHTFRRAWDTINPKVATSFWEALNIYVMIVTGPSEDLPAKPSSTI